MAEVNNKFYKYIQNYEQHALRISRATTVKVNESLKDKQARIKRLNADYIAWFEYYFPNYAKCKCAWFHKKAAQLLIKNKVIRLLLPWYRSAAKSVHVDMGIPLYLYLACNDLKFMLLVGETQQKANTLLSSVQAQLQFNNRLKSDYGERFKLGDWADGDFSTTDGVRFKAVGFLVNPRGSREEGERPDYIAVDDVDNRLHVNNDRLMQEGVNFVTEDVWGCFDSAEGGTERFVYANNDFNRNSITHRLGEYFKVADAAAKQEGFKSIFHILKINAVKDFSTFEPEWPEKTSADYWRKKYTSTPYRSFMREYMNTHIQDGAVFKYEDVQFTEVKPLDKYEALCFYGDLSYKDAGDYKALILVGKIKREYHVIYTYLSRGSRAKCAEWLYNLYSKKDLARFNIRYLIEGLFAMDEFVSDFDIVGDQYGFHIPVVADKRGKANKFDRIESIAGHFERKNVFFSIAERDMPDQVTLRDQLLAFEKGSKANDDGPDALHGAFSNLDKATFEDRFAPVFVSRREIRSKSKNSY